MNAINIDPEFKALIPPLSHEERAMLEASIVAEGCRDAVVIWAEHELLLDGHNRVEICEANRLPFDRVFVHLPTRNDAIMWIIRNQLGRRNLIPAVRVQLALRLKPVIAEQAKTRLATSTGGANPRPTQIFGEAERGESNEQVAKAAGVSHETVRKVEVVLERGDEITQAAMLSGDMSVSAAYETTKPQSHQLINSSASNEWYTPSAYIEAARRVMGSIDLDPASCEAANETVQAGEFFAIEDDGLTQQWYGNVWLNPPYGYGEGNQSNQSLWVDRMLAAFISGEVNQAVLLVNAVPGNKWFAPLFDYLICFTDHRIKFTPPNGNAPQPTHSNALVYFGNDGRGFVREFTQFGTVVARVVINE